MDATSKTREQRMRQADLLAEGKKHCTKCSTTKDVEAFARNRARYDGLSIWCKECVATYNRARNQRPDIKARNAEQAIARYHRLSDEEKAAHNSMDRRKKWHLQGRYNVTLGWYYQTLKSQGGGCAICQQEPPTDGYLCVDHDHACCSTSGQSCGQCVRGLLCFTCNVQLHWMENVDWRNAADSYLSREIDRLEKGNRPS